MADFMYKKGELNLLADFCGSFGCVVPGTSSSGRESAGPGDP